MDILPEVARIAAELDRNRVRYGLIGGLAMAVRGVQRATFDLDFLLMLSDLERTHDLLLSLGYQRAFHSQNVSHYQKPGAALSRVDILHAFRGPSLGMLERAERLELAPGCVLPVLRIEDIIGLKIQASVNNPHRALGDWSDIHRLLKHAAQVRLDLRWDLLADYLEIFRLSARLPELRALYDEAH